MKTLVRFLKDESGATMVEYAVLVALITVAVVAVVFLLGTQLQTTFQSITDCLADPENCPGEE
jgi:pilus assembly protein Flp/PilA